MKQENEILSMMLLKFLDNFETCDPGEQDEFMSTGDIMEIFQEFYPGYYDETELAGHLAMHCEPHFDALLRKFVWLLKAKTPRLGQ